MTDSIDPPSQNANAPPANRTSDHGRSVDRHRPDGGRPEDPTANEDDGPLAEEGGTDDGDGNADELDRDDVAENQNVDGAADGDGDGDVDEEDSRNLANSLEWAGLIVLGLLAVIATFRFYLAASTAIGRLVTPEYEPLFQAGFNLAILLVAIAGISVLVQRIVLAD